MIQRRWIVAAIGVGGLIAGARSAWSLEVSLPEKTRAKASIVVDEAGAPLFGAAPGQVEITNPSIAVEVLNPTPCDCGVAVPEPGLPFRASFNTAGAWSPLVTVPVGKTYTVTDVVTGESSGGPLCQLRVNGGSSLLKVGYPHAFATGLEFVEGDLVEVSIYGGTCLISGVVRDVVVP